MRFINSSTATVAAMAALVVAVLGLTACAGGTTHAPSSHAAASSTRMASATTSALASATPTPTRTGPLTTGPNVRPGEKPPVAALFGLEHDGVGAMGFATYFFKAFDWSLATNDTYLLRRASAPDCEACRQIISRFATLATKHQHIEGGRVTIQGAGDVTDQYKTTFEFVINMRTSQEAIKIVDSAGKTVSAERAVTNNSLVMLSWHSGAWQVHDVTAAR